MLTLGPRGQFTTAQRPAERWKPSGSIARTTEQQALLSLTAAASTVSGASGRGWVAQVRKSQRARRVGCCCRHRAKVHSHTELLVDGDTHSIDMIRASIQSLKAEKRIVSTRVFAPPGRALNKRWQQLFRDSEINFQAVARLDGSQGEANDEAIMQEMQRLSRQAQVGGSIALLVSDTDFCEAVGQAIVAGSDVTVLTRAGALTTKNKFQTMGARVVPLPPKVDNYPRVRAILKKDGTGFVRLARPPVTTPSLDKFRVTSSFLQDLGYRNDNLDLLALLQSIAKFWYANSLGPLTVFPWQIAIDAAYATASSPCQRKFLRNEEELAFILPVSSRPSRKGRIPKYGTGLARSVFRGGGPFMLKDSADVVARALRRLGYLDLEWNSNLPEAMRGFCNVAENKQNLRKVGQLPVPSNTASEVEDKLRWSLLSNSSSFQWRTAPKDTDVRNILFKEGLLDTGLASKRRVFSAMRELADREGWPMMQNYNSFCQRILQSWRSRLDPTHTGIINFKL